MSTVNLSKIKEIAEAKRVPMAQVAEAAGITPTGLSHLIRVNSTRVDTLEKIADFLGVAITDFFTDAPTPAPVYGNTANVGSKFHGSLNVGSDQNISRALDILEHQLKAKDEQISGLITALNK